MFRQGLSRALLVATAGSVTTMAQAQQRIWLGQFGTSAQDFPLALAPDAGGGFYVAGLTSGSLAVPAGAHSDAFLARIDRNGAMIRVRQFGVPETDYATSLAADAAGGVVVAGFTQGNVAGTNAGGNDAFVGRFDSSGNQVWMRQFGTPSDDSVEGVAPDGAGGVLRAGRRREVWGAQRRLWGCVPGSL